MKVWTEKVIGGGIAPLPHRLCSSNKLNQTIKSRIFMNVVTDFISMWECDPVLSSGVVSSYNAVGPLFVHTLQSLLAAQCALSGDQLWPSDAEEAVIHGTFLFYIDLLS